MLPPSFLAISSLLLFTTAQVITGASQFKYSHDPRSFLCDRKLFLSRIIKLTLKLATNTLSSHPNLRIYMGNTLFEHIGPIYIWPLPANVLIHPWRTGPESPYYVVLGGQDRQFLGVIHRLRGNVFARCIEAKAGGEIKSILYPDGVFQCLSRISEFDAVKYALDMRKMFQKKEFTQRQKYPFYYEGDLVFPGLGPHLISPISIITNTFAKIGKQFLVMDMNFNVVDAVQWVHRKLEQCRQIYPEKQEISIHIASVSAKHCETGSLKFHDKYISVQQILRAAKDAHIGFRRKRIDEWYAYPTPYFNLNLNHDARHDLYLWPVSEEDQKIRQLMTPTKETFCLVIDRSGNVYDVVAKVGGTYQSFTNVNLCRGS